MSFHDLLHGLYVITDDRLTPPQTLLTQVTSALEGGATIVQLRDKKSSDEEIRDTALKLQDLCKSYNALFVLNDKVELAMALGLSGLHIGKSDHHRVTEIRKNFKGCLGVSCYGDINLAQKMQDIGIDYVAFGSFYTSPTKPQANIVDLEIISQAKEALEIPVCAIGGINSDNAAELMQHRPDMLAIVNGIWSSEDITQRSHYFTHLIRSKK